MIRFSFVSIVRLLVILTLLSSSLCLSTGCSSLRQKFSRKPSVSPTAVPPQLEESGAKKPLSFWGKLLSRGKKDAATEVADDLVTTNAFEAGGEAPGTPPPVVPAENGSEVVFLRPGLTLSVTVLVSGKKEVEEPLRRISDKCLIELPFLGAVSVKGMQASALSAHLAGLYREYYVDPQVIVDFAKSEQLDGVSPWGFVTVLGRVKKPGRIAIPPTRDLTVSGAIQKADGYDTSARQTAIRVTRQLPDGTTETRDVDLYSVGAKGNLKEDMILQPEDVVFVPEEIF